MIVPLIVACALFMENLDGTVITTALPAMAESFGTSPIHLSLGITVYMFSLGIFIPISGWVADRFGARTVFRAAIGVFTLGSILCGLTNGIVELALARIVQGIGGAMMVPVGRLVLLRSVEKADLVRAMAYLTVPALVGPVLGPPVGGFITTFLSWRWIFFLNVPIGLLGMVLVTFLLEDQRADRRAPFDWLGFFLTGVALSAIMYDSDLVARPDVRAGFCGAFWPWGWRWVSGPSSTSGARPIPSSISRCSGFRPSRLASGAAPSFGSRPGRCPSCCPSCCRWDLA